jgi:hypothetical protein
MRGPLGSHEAPVKAVSFERFEALIEAISDSTWIDLSNHCLLLYDRGGQSRGSCRVADLRGPGDVLHAASPLPFPLSLIPSHHILVRFHQPSSLKIAFDRLAPYSPSIIYAPTAFQAAFLARLRSPRFFNFRARYKATEYRDLLAVYGDNYFAIEAYLHDNYLVEYKYGPDLRPELQDMLETLDSLAA